MRPAWHSARPAEQQEGSKRTLHGVEGRFLLASEKNARAHATALVLGWLYLLTSQRLVSERMLPYLLRLLQQKVQSTNTLMQVGLVLPPTPIHTETPELRPKS